MKTLALSNGDLVVGQSGYVTISGAQKVQQDLALALGEYWGNDRFHADRWGSIVTDFIGSPIDDDLIFQVRSEVARTIGQYISIQSQEIYADFISGKRSRASMSDVIREITSINVTTTNTEIDIFVTLVTQAGQTVQLNRTVGI